MTRHLLLIVGFLIYAPFLFAQSPNEVAKKYAQEAAAANRGESIYRDACEACHGATGDGNGPAAKALNPRPRDFTRAIYKFRSTPDGYLPTDEDLFRTIYDGVPRTLMPAWKNLLSEQNIKDVVAYIKSFSPKFEEWGAGTPIAIPEESPATDESIFEGEQAYKIMECWSCHGPQGRGNGPSAFELIDDWHHPIKPFDFTRGGYKAGNSSADIFKTINGGLNGTPMPAYQESFLYPREAFEDLANLAEVYSQNEIEELSNYGKTLPTDEEIESMSDEEREALANKRRWALVHYVKSLSRKTSIFRELFVEKTDETK